MPKTPVATARAEDTTPKMMKPFRFHGVDFTQEDGAEVVGTCPFCGREGKFYLETETGVWSCKVCETGTRRGGGNVYTFIREIMSMSTKAGNGLLKTLNTSRKMLNPATLEAWGVFQSSITGDYMIPAYNHEGKLTQLYKYTKTKEGMKLYGTPELNVAMYGGHLFDKNKSEVWITEGPWDAMAAWEIINGVKSEGDKGWTPTANKDLSIGNDVNVIAIPGAGVFQESWVSLFKDKMVTIFFDSDHPKEHNGRDVGCAGYKGSRRTAGMLARPDGTGAKEVHYLAWGPDGYDPSKPSGYDVRDHVTQGKDLRTRAGLLRSLVTEKVKPIPPEWVGMGKGKSGSSEINLIECTSWEQLREDWIAASKFTPGHEYALASMLACAVTTRVPGSQVWLQVISPPSTGKTLLSEGLSSNRKYTHTVDEFTGLFSGYTDGTDKDFSPIKKFIDKTLIVKEAANILAADNRNKLMADLTAAFDRKSGREWKQGKSVEQGGMNMTVIIQGTNTLRQMDMSETGARFLTCAIMNHIDGSLEDDILERASFMAIRNMALETNCSIESHYEPDKLKAIQKTGYYLGWLRDNANELCGVVSQNFPDSYRRLCCDYAKAISYLRARPSKVQDETADREMATRVTEQVIKMAIGYAVVTNRRSVDAHCMKWVRQIMLDSTYGKSFELVKRLRADGGKDGLLLSDLNQRLGETEKKMESYRSFLCKIGVCELVTQPVSQYSRNSISRIKVSDKMTRLWDNVMKEQV